MYEFLNSVQAIIAIVIAIASMAGAFVYNVKKYLLKIKKLENATVAIMGDRLVNNYYKYKHRGKIARYELESMKRIYAEYKTLDGNGFVDKCFELCMELPQEGGE